MSQELITLKARIELPSRLHINTKFVPTYDRTDVIINSFSGPGRCIQFTFLNADGYQHFQLEPEAIQELKQMLNEEF